MTISFFLIFLYFLTYHYNINYDKKILEKFNEKYVKINGKIISNVKYYDNFAKFNAEIKKINDDFFLNKFNKIVIPVFFYQYNLKNQHFFDYFEDFEAEGYIKLNKYNNKLEFNIKNETFTRLENKKDLRKNIKNYIKYRLEKLFKNYDNLLDFSKALIIGDRSEIAEDVLSSFRNTGTMHILAVSGLHIGLLVFFISFLFLGKYLNFSFKNILIILIILFYSYILGFMPSVVRAALMCSIYLLGCYSPYKTNFYNVLGLAGTIILFYSPEQLFELGFQLSFAATFSIVFFSKFFKFVNNYSLNKILKYMINSFIISLSAFLGTSAIIFYNFKQINLFGIIINIPIVILFSIITFLNYVIFLFSYIIPQNILNILLIVPTNYLLNNSLILLNYLNKFDYLIITSEKIFLFTILLLITIIILLKINSNSLQTKENK